MQLSEQEIQIIECIRNKTMVAIPKTPTPGILMSMALRVDHGLGCPGYYDQFNVTGEAWRSHARRLEVALSDARKQYEEIAGTGFYSKDREDYYCSLIPANVEIDLT
jgi:hypothetical protein